MCNVKNKFKKYKKTAFKIFFMKLLKVSKKYSYYRRMYDDKKRYEKNVLLILNIYKHIYNSDLCINKKYRSLVNHISK